MKRTLMVLVSLFVAIGFAAALPAGWDWADLSHKKDDVAGILPYMNPLKVQGDIVTSGSSTVFPLSERMASRFAKEGYKGQIKLDSIGTGAGMERFAKGECDIGNASRGINQKEADAAKAAGMNVLEFRVATDALTIIANKGNKFLTNLTKDQVAKLFVAEKWSDVDATWPAEKIMRFVPSAEHGTFDYFAEVFYAKKKEPLLNAPNTSPNQDYNLLITGVEGNVNALGFIGYSYFEDSAAKLKAISYEGVFGNAKTVDDGSYKLARPLFMYVDAKVLKAKPQVAAFINYYLTFVNQEVKKVGFFPAPAAALSASKKSWADALADVLKK